ncbi:hypothetical protein BGZ98_008889 [Dissophora globulifera]|nr:hypothetical protein BGZ98_008889 [Dissophora globulifera]
MRSHDQPRGNTFSLLPQVRVATERPDSPEVGQQSGQSLAITGPEATAPLSTAPSSATLSSATSSPATPSSATPSLVTPSPAKPSFETISPPTSLLASSSDSLTTISPQDGTISAGRSSESEIVLDATSNTPNSVSICTVTRTCIIEKRVSSDEIKAGRYNLVLCLGMGAGALLQDIVLQDVIEQITFSIYTDGQVIGRIAASERDIKQIPRSPEVHIRLHRNFEVFTDAINDYKIVIKIATRENIGNTLLSFELRALKFYNVYIPRQTIEEHDIFGTESKLSSFTAVVPGATPNTPLVPAKINALAISETGRYLAVLSFADSRYYIRITDSSHEKGIVSATKAQCMYLNGVAATSEQVECLRIAISNNGTQVAIFQSVSDAYLEAEEGNTTTLPVSNSFPFLVVNFSNAHFNRPLSNKVLWLKYFDPQLSKFVGFGKFATAPDGEELFVSCDGLSVMIHHTKFGWKRLHRITLQPDITIPLSTAQSPKNSLKDLQMGKELIESAQGTYFAWLGNPMAVSIWSMEMGHMVSFIVNSKLPITAAGVSVRVSGTGLRTRVWSPNTSLIRIASHGRYMAIANNSQICKYLLPSGTRVGITDVTSGLKKGSTIIDVCWIEDRLLVVYQEDQALATFLVSLDVERQHWGDRRIIPFNSMEHSVKVCNKVYTVHGSTVDISSVSDLIEVSSLQERDHDCKCDVASEAAEDTSLLQEYTFENGGRIELKADTSSDTVNLLLQPLPPVGSQPRQCNFIARGWRKLAEHDVTLLPAFILEGTSRFVIIGAGYVQVWQLPPANSESCRLVVMATAPAAVMKDESAQRNPQLTVGQHMQYLTICQHMRYLTVQFGEEKKRTIDMLRECHDHLVDSEHLQDWSTLVQLYSVKDGDPEYRKALLQYTVQAFKQCQTWNYSKNVFLLRLCEKWKTEGFEEFLENLVQQPDFVWIPAFPASRYKDNAIAFGIITSWDHTHRNVQFHNTLIKHCIQNAMQDGDTFFLKPIFDCLPLIIDEPFGLEVMRQLAFIPVPESSRVFIIENSVLSHINSIFRRPLESFRIKVYEDDAPILRLYRMQELDPENKYFKKRLFVAPLEMLYQTRAYNVVEFFQFFHWNFFQVSDKTANGLVSGPEYDKILRERISIRRPSFSLQMLDNPTIEVHKFRVFKKFCKFLDFIFRLTADIGLFFALFAFGVIAFAQVFWFLIHACLGVVCQESKSQFPKNFIEAIFATYFFLVSTGTSRKRLIFESVVYFTGTDDDILKFHQKYIRDSRDFLNDRGVVETVPDSKTIVLKDQQIEALKSEVAHMNSQVVALQNTIATLAAAGLKTHHGSIEE